MQTAHGTRALKDPKRRLNIQVKLPSIRQMAQLEILFNSFL